MEKFVEGRVYINNKGLKVICTKVNGNHAEFDIYNRRGTIDMHERSTIYTSQNGMYEVVLLDSSTAIHSIECIEYTEKMINTLMMIKENLVDAETIDVATSEIFTNNKYYKFQRTQYSKPIYFSIDSFYNKIKIELVNSEYYEEQYTEKPCTDINELSNYLNEFIINTNKKEDQDNDKKR